MHAARREFLRQNKTGRTSLQGVFRLRAHANYSDNPVFINKHLMYEYGVVVFFFRHLLLSFCCVNLQSCV